MENTFFKSQSICLFQYFHILKAEDELQQCQVEFANQVEVTQDSMRELSHIQVDHLKHLTAFVQAQVEDFFPFEKKKIS